MATTLNIKELFDFYNLKETKVATEKSGDSLIDRAKDLQEKLASAIKDEQLEEIQTGLTTEESIIIKVADL